MQLMNLSIDDNMKLDKWPLQLQHIANRQLQTFG